jgi:uncharacterized membrane protein YbhN (UPF0104 family)
VTMLLLWPPQSERLGLVRGIGWVVLALFAILLAFLLLAYRNRALAVRITHRLADPISPRLAERAAGMLDAFIHGLRLVPSRRKLAAFFLLSCIYWALNGWGMQILARGFDLPLTLGQCYVVLGVLVVGVMVPAAPGMVGTFQYSVLLGLSLFTPAAVLDVHGQAYAYVLWAAQLFQLTAFGLFFLFSRHIQIARIFRAPEELEEELEVEEREYRSAERPDAPDPRIGGRAAASRGGEEG